MLRQAELVEKAGRNNNCKLEKIGIKRSFDLEKGSLIGYTNIYGISTTYLLGIFSLF